MRASDPLRGRAAHVLRLRRAGWTGGHDVVGATSPADTWYFAEGYTGPGFDEWICVLNPGQRGRRPDLLLPDPGGGRDGARPGYSVPAALPRHLQGQRRARRPTTRPRSSSESDQPVVAERPMYFDYRAPAAGAGPAATAYGRPLPRPRVLLRGGHHPGRLRGVADPAEPRTTPRSPSPPSTSWPTGDPVTRSYTVPAGSRYDRLRAGRGGRGARTSPSTSPRLRLPGRAAHVLRLLGHGRLGWTGGHCVIGAVPRQPSGSSRKATPGPASRSGCASRTPGTPTPHVAITYYPEGGARPSPGHTVAAGTPAIPSTSTTTPARTCPSAPSLTSDQPVIVRAAHVLHLQRGLERRARRSGLHARRLGRGGC